MLWRFTEGFIANVFYPYGGGLGLLDFHRALLRMTLFFFTLTTTHKNRWRPLQTKLDPLQHSYIHNINYQFAWLA